MGLGLMKYDARLNIRETAEFPVELHECIVIDEQVKGDPGIVVVRGDTKQIVSRMSSQYQLIPHADVLDAAESVFDSNGLNAKLVRMMMSGSLNTTMRARYTIEKPFRVNGDDHLPIVDICNSYDGVTRFNCAMGTWRLICSNGMMGFGEDANYNRIHIRESVKLDGLFTHIDEWINTKLPGWITKLSFLPTAKPVDFECFDRLMRPKELEAFIEQGRLDQMTNKWSQLQAVTSFAQELGTDRQVELESKVYKFLINN